MAHISIKTHAAPYLPIAKKTHLPTNYISDCDSAAVKALEMGAPCFETGGMKRNATAAVKAGGIFQCSPAHITNFAFWMA